MSKKDSPADTFQSLVEELVRDDNTHSWTCADEGTFCTFCGVRWGHWYTPTVHSPTCWLVRAEKLLAIKQVD